MVADEHRPNLRGRAGRMRGGRGSGRSATGTVRLWGRHAVEAALANPRRTLHKLWATREAAAGLADAVPAGLALEYAQGADLARHGPRDAPHQGLVLECGTLPDLLLSDVLEQVDGRPLVFLDQVTDPHNVGAVFRSAAAFGAAAVVTQDRHAPPESGTLAKSASGALEVVPWVRVVNLARALDEVAKLGWWRIGLAGEAESEFADVLPSAPVCLVLGAEGEGLRHNVAAHCDVLARLPIRRAVESLNISNAAAIALYEVAQRNARGRSNAAGGADPV